MEAEAPDYEAIARRLIAENEHIRVDLKNARVSLNEEIAYYIRLALDFVRDPNNQMLVWFGAIIVMFLFKTLVSYLHRRKKFL